MRHLPVEPHRFLRTPEPAASLLSWAVVFGFLALVAGVFRFTRNPAIAVAGLLFFLAFITSVTLLVLWMAARRR